MGGFIGPALSIGGALLGGSSGADSAPTANVYQPLGTANQDQNLNNLLNQNTTALTGGNNPFSQYSPQIMQAFQSLFNNPGTAGYTAGANAAGNAYNTVGNQSIATSGGLNTAALSALPQAQMVANLGIDPQNDLYKQLFQQTTDAANVNNARYGLTGQQAAGNVTTADSNFNIDWQNQQLQRALAGLGGLNDTLGKVGTATTAAQNTGAAGAGSLLAGGAAPYTANQTVGGNQETALTQLLSQLLGGVNATSGTIGDLQNYLNTGVGASESQNQQQLQDYYAQLTGATGGAAAGSNIGGQLGGLFSTSSSGGGSSISPAMLAQLAAAF